MSKKPKLRYKCWECSDRFPSWQARDVHKAIAHQPPTLPKVDIQTAPMIAEERTLIGGRDIEIGDVVYLGRKAVVTQIKKTEGSNDVEVTIAITKHWYSRNEIK